MAGQSTHSGAPGPRRGERARSRTLIPLGVTLLILAGALTGVRAGDPETVDVDSYRHIPELRYESARVIRGRYTRSIHLIDADGRRYRLPLGRRIEAFEPAALARSLSTDSVAEVWLKDGDGYPVIKGIRSATLTLDPAEAVPLDRRRRFWLSVSIPITLVSGVLALLLGARRLRARPEDARAPR